MKNKFAPAFDWELLDSAHKPEECKLGHSLKFILDDKYVEHDTYIDKIRVTDPNHVFHGYLNGIYLRVCRHEFGIEDNYHWAIDHRRGITLFVPKKTIFIIRNKYER